MTHEETIRRNVAKKIGVKIDYTPEEIEKTRQEIGNGTKRWCTNEELMFAKKHLDQVFKEKYL